MRREGRQFLKNLLVFITGLNAVTAIFALIAYVNAGPGPADAIYTAAGMLVSITSLYIASKKDYIQRAAGEDVANAMEGLYIIGKIFVVFIILYMAIGIIFLGGCDCNIAAVLVALLNVFIIVFIASILRR